MDDFSGKINEKWEEAKRIAKDPATKEKVQDICMSVKEESIELYEKAKVKFNEVKEDERVKEFLANTSEKIDETVNTIQESETYNKVKDNVSNAFESIKNDENVKAGVKKAKIATLSLAKKALSSIEKMLDEEDEDKIIHEVKSDDLN